MQCIITFSFSPKHNEYPLSRAKMHFRPHETFVKPIFKYFKLIIGAYLHMLPQPDKQNRDRLMEKTATLRY